MAATHHVTPGPVRVLSWHLALFRRLWVANVLSGLVQPLLYLLGLGVGVGALVDRNTDSTQLLGGSSYVAFVVPGLLATATMAIAAAESMWPVMGGLTWQRSYFGLASTPLGPGDIVGGHALWIACRSTVASTSVAAVLAVFPRTRSWGLIPSALVAVLVGLAFAMPIMAFSINAKMDGSFAAIQRFLVIPLFLFGGAFYPISQLPAVVQWYARAFPLWHGVVVSRQFTTGHVDWPAVGGHLAYIAAFAVAGTMWSTRRLARKLYT